MNENIIYAFIILVAYIAYKKYSQHKVLKLVPTLLSQGGQIVDVRSESEFAFAHKVGSINIPLDLLKSRMSELDNTKPVILCCASGSRSSFAKRILMANGFKNVHNAGTWDSLTK
ncbi:rhodanese-like domain-containing protein [Arcobacter venerupis]|uniref:Rhodanese-like domain-containing protein n=1 Tax=Arcobacter venerupis TaxID=1054033 RepID=A0AAE7BC00_9BACT|nr:rhodanese-like domain-containing protein [Arcobacter venerupis]QKF67482.1 rhodanese-like domain-containing protein [Arcobacter venerupis]